MSFAVSVPLDFGVGPGLSVRSHFIDFGAPSVEFIEFGLPQGTDVAVVWQPALQSTDLYGRFGEFIDGVELPQNIQEFDVIRFFATLTSDFNTAQAPSIKTIRMLYKLQDATDN